MNRLYPARQHSLPRSISGLAACCLYGALAFACGPKEFGSVCNDVPVPAACMTSCNPMPGAANTCPTSFHCSPDGKCDAQCTPGGSQCGDGYMCTNDGYCVDGSGPGSSAPDATCPAINFTPMPTTPSITLVLDRSGSMAGTDISPTRYGAMQNALVGTSGVVTQLEAKAYFGSILYGCNGSTFSPAAIPRALSNAAAIRTSIANTTPNGGTPTAAALTLAKTDFMSSPPPAGSPPVIVLATDGEPNSCNGTQSQSFYNQESEDAAGAAFAAGFPVYVLAIGPQTNAGHFQRLANRGQGSSTNVTYYPVTNATGLQAAFQTIINGVISCDLTLTSAIDPGQAANGTVTLNGTTLTYGTDWMLVAPGNNIIRLTGAACNTLKTTTNPMVGAQFPCGSVIF